MHSRIRVYASFLTCITEDVADALPLLANYDKLDENEKLVHLEMVIVAPTHMRELGVRKTVDGYSTWKWLIIYSPTCLILSDKKQVNLYGY